MTAADRGRPGLNRRLAGASARKAPQNPGDPNLPAPVHRRLRLAQPAATLLNRQTLCQSEQYVRDIDWVAGEQSGVGAPDAAIGRGDDDERPTWGHVQIGEQHLAPPSALSARFAAGQFAPASES